MIQQKRSIKTDLFLTIFFCLSAVGFTPKAVHAENIVDPDWSVSYRFDGTNIVADGEYSLPLSASGESVYGWPVGYVPLGTIYADLYKGTLNDAQIIAGHALLGDGAATTSDTFLETGTYFVTVYEFYEGLCGSDGDFCVLPTIGDARWWFTRYRADYEECISFFTDPVEASANCATPLSMFGIAHFGFIPFTVIDGVVVPPLPPVPDAFSNVAFLPGLEASRLYVSDGGNETRLWEPRLNGDVERLFLNPDGTSIESGIYTRDIIDESNSLPLTPPPLFGLNIYKNFMSFMDELVASSTVREWRAFPYDWRMSLDDVVAGGAPMEDGSFFDIVGGIEDLAATSATGKVTIIGHSNGGLLGKLIIDELVSRGEGSLVDKFIMIGTPQAGTPKALAGLLHGDGLDMPDGHGFLMSKSTARELSTNMPSTYTLLPSDGYVRRVVDPVIEFDPLAHVLDGFRELYGLAINTAVELESFLRGDDGARTQPESAAIDVPNVANTLLYNRARVLQARLDAWTAPAGVQVFQIAGWGLQTLRGTYYTERKVMKCNENLSVCLPTGVLDREPLVTADGDKTVVTPSAGYMGGVETFYVDLKGYNDEFVDRSHADILEAIPTQQIVQNLIVDDISVLPQFISTAKPTTERNLRIRVHSPVSLDIYDSNGFHTGIATSSASDLRAIDEQIPNSFYMEFGEGKYIGLDGGDEYTILLRGLDTGTFTLGVDTIENDVVMNSVVYENIPVTEDTIGEILVQSTGSTTGLSLDMDGNGRVDAIVTTDTTDPHAYAELMEEVLESMHLSKSTEKKIEKPLDEVEDALENKNWKKNSKKILKKIDELKEIVQKLGKRRGAISVANAETLLQMIEQLRLLVIQ